MDTFGFHSIHGRAPAVATGAKLANPDLSVWVITGDGDAMSIGGNHFIHVIRRNVDMNILMFNNQIYGLTKGQYSPTSELGKVTKSTPMGSLDFPFNPPQLTLGAGGTFVARTLDREMKHMAEIIKEANLHQGTSFIEIYQNCNIFNDGAFSHLTNRETKKQNLLILKNGQPMVFGDSNDKGLILEGSNLKVVSIGSEYSMEDILIHNKSDKNLAMLLSEITYDEDLPVPIGVIYKEDKPTYDSMLVDQLSIAKEKKKDTDLQFLISGPNTWKV